MTRCPTRHGLIAGHCIRHMRLRMRMISSPRVCVPSLCGRDLYGTLGVKPSASTREIAIAVGLAQHNVRPLRLARTCCAGAVPQAGPALPPGQTPSQHARQSRAQVQRLVQRTPESDRCILHIHKGTGPAARRHACWCAVGQPSRQPMKCSKTRRCAKSSTGRCE
jgi:hypothetical protein